MVKTDNHNLGAKLALRRMMLDKYSECRRVVDCCQGTGAIWKRLQKEYELESYLGLDVKRRTGALKLDSVRYLKCPGRTENVVDVDCYGRPWAWYFAAVERLAGPTIFFLTIGLVNVNGIDSGLSKLELQVMGIQWRELNPPGAMLGRFRDFAELKCLLYVEKYGTITDMQEAFRPGVNVRYIGLRVEPKRSL